MLSAECSPVALTGEKGYNTVSMSVVSVKDVEHVALLARLQLQPDELAKLAGQLDEILQYVQQLQTVSTKGVEPTSHVLGLSNITRADESVQAVSPEAVLSLAPARQGPFFKVPKVIETS